MDARRRSVLAGAAAALAGCSTIEGLARDVARPDTHPLEGSNTVEIVDRSRSDHDLEALTGEALAFWNENAPEYAGFEVDFRIGDDAPDVEIIYVDTREDLQGCHEYASEQVLGCAPLLRVGDRLNRPATVEVVATDRPYGDVRITTQHELGHTLGLDHDDEPAYIMSNRIEDRLPGFEHRIAVLEAQERALRRRNEATGSYNEGIRAWNDRDYERAAERFDRSEAEYRSVLEEVEAARDRAGELEGIERPDTVDLEALREHFDRSERNVELAAEAASEMAAATRARARGNAFEARDRRERANELMDEASELGFPSPAVVAVSLGLIDEPETTEAEPGDA